MAPGLGKGLTDTGGWAYGPSTDCGMTPRHGLTGWCGGELGRGIRTDWAARVGEPSRLVIELHVEAAVPGSGNAWCRVRGSVGVPSAPRSDAERYHLAGVLVGHAGLPRLQRELDLRILDMTTKRLGEERTIEVGEGGLSMPRSMWWEKEYVERPYMRGLPMKGLNERFHDIALNLLKTTEGGKIGMNITSAGIEWGRYMQHVLEEAGARELPYPLFLDKRHAPDWTKDGITSSVTSGHSVGAFEAVKAWADGGGDHRFTVAKYGERRWMERLLSDGEILVRPSADYDDEAFNRAQRDDENSVSVFGARTGDGTAVPASDLPGWWGDRYSMTEFAAKMDRDYMLYCMARTLSPTLFSHFGEEYDACVLIHDFDEFARRVDEGTRNCFPPGEFLHAHCWTTYIDPLSAIQPTPKPRKRSTAIPIPFLKHFRYAYQKEYRFVWVPSEPRSGLEATCVRIGPLGDIAEIIRT